MTKKIKAAIVCSTTIAVISCAIFSTNASTYCQNRSAEPDFSSMPAVTFQVKTWAELKGKYTKMHTEANCGLWIALDHTTDSLYYKVLQEDTGPSLFDMSSTLETIKYQMEAYEPKIKEVLSEIINFQEAKRYLEIMKNYIFSDPLPNFGDINTYIRQLIEEKLPCHNKETRVSGKKISDFLDCEECISLYQRKFNIDSENIKEINHMLKTAQNYIDSHPLSDNLKFSWSFMDNPYQYNGCHCEYNEYLNYYFAEVQPPHIILPDKHTINPYEDIQFIEECNCPYTIQFANITSNFNKEISESTGDSVEYKTTLKTFLYMPPAEHQYSDYDDAEYRLNMLAEKYEYIENFLKENKGKDILRPNASVRIKEYANDFTTLVIREVRNVQHKINDEIDKVCNRISGFFK